MPENSQVPEASTNLRDAFVILASVVVILAGARYAANVLVPFLLAVFIAIICASFINSLKARGLPRWLALCIVLSLFFGLLLLMFLLLGTATNSFIGALPGYEAKIDALVASWATWLSGYGIEIGTDAINGLFDPATVLGYFRGFLSGLGGVLSNLLLILLAVIFMLADAPGFNAKVAHSNSRKQAGYLSAFNDLTLAMNGYLVAKTMISLVTGILIWFGLWALDVRFSILWGFLAFALNFVPNIGSIIAALPAVLLSLVEVDLLLTGLIILLYAAVNILIGNIVEPRWLGQRLGLSTLSVFLSLIFWGWMFGPVGMFLSVPLTMSLKFLAARNRETAWLSMLLANSSTENPDSQIVPGTQGAGQKPAGEVGGIDG